LRVVEKDNVIPDISPLLYVAIDILGLDKKGLFNGGHGNKNLLV
jgi:hypothetical protein